MTSLPDSSPPASSSTPPRRCIYNDADLAHFLASPCKSELLRLVAAQGKSCATSSFVYQAEAPLRGLSPAMACLHGALGALLDWVSDYPPVHSSHIRFGNPAFKDWHKRLTERSTSIVSTILKTAAKHPGGEEFELQVLEESAASGRQAADVETSASSSSANDDNDVDLEVVAELECYLHDAFGHAIRLDYGTGHESSFQVFLFVLCKLHCFGSTAEQPPSLDRLKATTLSIYQQYLQLTRKLQTDYMLEPAGSHGVWGLDDYHCLPFYFGACQLQMQHEYTPASIQDLALLESEGDNFMYFGCIRFIRELKKGVPFFESSPMLNDISQLGSWSKVASGLLKMYEGEVLKKRQVVQHFRFGKIFAANWTPSQAHPLAAPTEMFRVPPGVQRTGMEGGAAILPSTKAPWAK